MKKALWSVLTASLLLPTVASFGQESTALQQTVDSKKFRFGVYIAPTMAWMKPTTDKTDDGRYAPTNEGSKVGFQYGLMAEYHFAENYAFVTGLQVNMAGGKIGTEFLGDKSTAKNVVGNSLINYRLNYLEIPVALKLRTDLISGFRFFGQLGLTTGFNIAKKATYDISYYNNGGNLTTLTGENEKIKGTLAIAPVMFTMNIGAGAEYPLNDKLAAYFGIFFNNGFAPDATNPAKYKMLNDLDISGGTALKDGNTRLNNFAIRLGLFF